MATGDRRVHDADADPKREMRARIRTARRGRVCSAEAVSAAVAASCARLGFRIEDAAAVCGYAALPGEPDPTALLEGLSAAGVPVLLPVSAPGEPLDFGALRGRIASLPRGLWGIREPADAQPAAAAIAAACAGRSGPGVVLAPGLAYSDAGARLGNGGGFYDRTFGPQGAAPRELSADLSARLRIVGVCWADEVGLQIAAEPWDLRADAACGVPFGT